MKTVARSREVHFKFLHTGADTNVGQWKVKLMKWTFERRLIALVLVALVGLVCVSLVSYRALTGHTRQIENLVQNQKLLSSQGDADMMHDALRADVVSALLENQPSAQSDVIQEVRGHAARSLEDMYDAAAVVAGLGLPDSDPLASSFAPASAALALYAEHAVAIVELAGDDRSAANLLLPSFVSEFEAVEAQMGQLTEVIESRALVAQRDAENGTNADATRTAMSAVFALTLLIVVVESTRRSVRSLLAARDLAERDAARISETVQRDAVRQHFKNRVHDALDMVDSESDVYAVVRRSMAATTQDAPAELLLADNSQAHLRLAVDYPESGGPGCPVQSPWDCVAVRRGQTTVFESSEELNVCPKLRDRPGGACSAVCVPVNFMGRALGVLHTTGPDMHPFDTQTVERLTVLATEAGTRIGTVRAFAKSQLQAATDPLTGLPNRRNLEEKVDVMLRSNTPFAVAVADLDHFKQINDKYGHDAGDRALRLFARVLRSSLSDDQIAARYGGEEFAIVLPNTFTDHAVECLEQLRLDLALALLDGRCPPFTASFGVSLSDAGDTLDEIIAVADEALFIAKETGRDRVVVAGERVSTSAANART